MYRSPPSCEPHSDGVPASIDVCNNASQSARVYSPQSTAALSCHVVPSVFIPRWSTFRALALAYGVQARETYASSSGSPGPNHLSQDSSWPNKMFPGRPVVHFTGFASPVVTPTVLGRSSAQLNDLGRPLVKVIVPGQPVVTQFLPGCPAVKSHVSGRVHVLSRKSSHQSRYGRLAMTLNTDVPLESNLFPSGYRRISWLGCTGHGRLC